MVIDQLWVRKYYDELHRVLPFDRQSYLLCIASYGSLDQSSRFRSDSVGELTAAEIFI
jgi:hypothetical protein